MSDGWPREVCADVARCPRWSECREEADRARWGDSVYRAMRAWVRKDTSMPRHHCRPGNETA
jgi:hypothetical protein